LHIDKVILIKENIGWDSLLIASLHNKKALQQINNIIIIEKNTFKSKSLFDIKFNNPSETMFVFDNI